MNKRNAKSVLNMLTAFAVTAVTAFFLISCAQDTTVSKIELGNGLPYFELTEELHKNRISKDTPEENLTAMYTSGSKNVPDIYVYSYEKAEGETLESFGQSQATEYAVFCNMISYQDCPCANVTYCRSLDDNAYIVRSYIFEGENDFVKLCFMHKTSDIKLGQSDLTISLMNGYTESAATGSIFPYEVDYEYEDEYLPEIRVRQFKKDYFTPDTYCPELMPNTTQQEYADWAKDGWTLDEAIAIYSDNYQLLKGERILRNGYEIAFIGYIDSGVFYVRAVIDCGEDYIMLCAENDAAKFQHVVNALIDTIN